MKFRTQLNHENLKNVFEAAKHHNAKYVGMLIEMPGIPKPEIIINESENFDSKLEYYLKTYDNELNHEYSRGVRIVGFTYGFSFSDIEEDLLG
jgi:hypothetical protein